MPVHQSTAYATVASPSADVLKDDKGNEVPAGPQALELQRKRLKEAANQAALPADVKAKQAEKKDMLVAAGETAHRKNTSVKEELQKLEENKEVAAKKLEEAKKPVPTQPQPKADKK